MKFPKISLALALTIVLLMPVLVSAASSAGIKPTSIFYFFDITAERVSLFLTFNPEKKARKALEYADERLAEAEAVAEGNNAEAVKTAITNYESSIAFAAEKSKDIKEKEKAEALLTTISDSTSKHQDVLMDVLAKVPDEAKEAITKAIEASRKGQEEAIRKIAELKGEVEQLKQELAELKIKDEERARVIEELSKQKPHATPTPASTSARPSTSKTPEIPPAPKSETTSQAPIKTGESQTTPLTISTQNNNISATPPPPASTPITPPPTTYQTETIEITSLGVVPDVTSTRIEWQTNKPASAKVFISGGGLSSKVYGSESGLSTRHIANITGLISNTSYSYQIESIAGEQVAKKDGSFSTKTGELTIQADKTSIQLADWNYIKVTAQYTEKGKAVPVDISFFAPDDSKTYKVIQNWPVCGNVPFLIQLAGTTGGYCSSDGKVEFQYRPKSLGAHTIAVSAKGVIKTIDIQVMPYVKIDPAIRDVVNTNTSFEVNSPDEKSIGSFKISPADEPTEFRNNYRYESNIQESGFLRLVSTGEAYYLSVRPKSSTYALKPGVHTVTITEITLVGISSGLNRKVTGLSTTFSFEVKDIPNPEIIPIKTTHTYTLPKRGSTFVAPGIIGSFKIKSNYNSAIKLISCRIRVEGNYPRISTTRPDNSTIEPFKGEIHEEAMRTSECSSSAAEVKTDSNGVSVTSYALRVFNSVGDTLQYFDLPSGQLKFYVEDLKVVDQRTGITRTVQNPPVFEMEIVRP